MSDLTPEKMIAFDWKGRRLPADWFTDSSLETWFPLTATMIAQKDDRIADLERQLSLANDANGTIEAALLDARRENAEQLKKLGDYNETVFQLSEIDKSQTYRIRDLERELAQVHEANAIVTRERNDAVRALRASSEPLPGLAAKVQRVYDSLHIDCDPVKEWHIETLAEVVRALNGVSSETECSLGDGVPDDKRAHQP